ncbi:MAG: RsmB/NOP family class I SAM-dependent RNA methyltransferase [Kofleriaceae bacterium]
MPAWIVDEVAAVLADEQDLAAAIAGLSTPARLAGRVNRRRGDVAAVVARLADEGASAEPAPGSPDGIYVDDLGDPGASPSHRAGLWTVQDLGAQRVARAAAPRPGERVLDACAGVGGKATHLAELADDAATIDAVDRSSTKLALAAASAQRLGLTSVRTVVADLQTPARGALAERYDRIVLDAPCSGLGVLRRHPEGKWRVTAADVARLAAVQAELLDAVVPRLADGGTLVYSVCTFTAAEGPAQVEALRARWPGLTLVGSEQTWPHRDGADAFYLATLRRG